MFYVSNIFNSSPDTFKTSLQEKTYKFLEKSDISFNRVDTDEAITMDDCILINKRLDMKMVKTLFLCNRQQTEFYLFITTGNKPFRSKDFSSTLEISRVSFAPSELMEKILGTKIGAATVFSLLLESSSDVNIVFDDDVLKEQWYGCSDGTTTGYLKIKTEDILNKLFSYTKRTYTTISI